MQAFQIPGVPESILTIRDGERHARYRRPIQGTYSLSNLKSYEPDVNEILNILISAFDQFDRKNEAVNISLWAYYCANHDLVPQNQRANGDHRFL